MADRLTQLQEAVNQCGAACCSLGTVTHVQLAEYFCSSVGVLQAPAEQDQPNSESQADAREPGNEPGTTSHAENAALFASLISRTAQDIDILIDSLPNQEYTPERQVERLQKLQTENQQAAEKLKKAVEEGDALLGKIREAMKDISDSHFGIKDEKAHR